MAQVRNISGTDLFVPAVARVVVEDEVIDVPDADFDSFVCQTRTWGSVEEPKKPAKKTASSKQKES